VAAQAESRRILGIRRPVFFENLWFRFFISPWVIGFLIWTRGVEQVRSGG
jgi:hypothetical protein